MSHREARSSHTQLQQHLPSPCAVLSPLHPDCSQTEPQWRLRWGNGCSASLEALQSGIPENRSPPPNSGPKGNKVCVFRDSVWLFFHIPETWCAKTDIKVQKCDLKQYRLSLTSSIRRTRRSFRAAMAVRSWENWLRPSSLSTLAAAKSSLSQSHSSTVAALREQQMINS